MGKVSEVRFIGSWPQYSIIDSYAVHHHWARDSFLIFFVYDGTAVAVRSICDARNQRSDLRSIEQIIGRG